MIAVVFAPVIGAIAFIVIQALAAVWTGALDEIPGVIVMAGFGMYPVGGPIALIAGLLVGMIAYWRTPTLVEILVAIVAANVVVLILQPIIGFGMGGFAVNLITSLFAGAVCWWIFRRLLAE